MNAHLENKKSVFALTTPTKDRKAKFLEIFADFNFPRKLRRELPAEEKEKIFSIIRELEKGAV